MRTHVDKRCYSTVGFLNFESAHFTSVRRHSQEGMYDNPVTRCRSLQGVRGECDESSER